MSAIENPLSLLSFDQPSSLQAVPIVPSYATANKIPVPLVDGISSSFKSPNVARPNSLASIVINGVTPPPSYREPSLYAAAPRASQSFQDEPAGNDPGLNPQGLPIIHILSKQPLPRSQWVGTSQADLKPFLSEGVNWKKVFIVLLIIFLIFFIIFIVGLLCKDSKRCNRATNLGTSRNKSAKVETSKIQNEAAHNTGASLGGEGLSQRVAGFSRLLRPGPQVQTSTLQPIVEKPEEEDSRRAKARIVV